MKARQYAEALYRAAHAHNAAAPLVLVERFAKLLTERGHASLLPAVVREYEKILHERSSSDEVHIRVARESDREKYAERIAADLATLAGTDREAHVTVDETVIGGYALEANGTRIDRTYKQALVELYSSLTNS
jgi:F0F1-type ATP synthase delta subunit